MQYDYLCSLVHHETTYGCANYMFPCSFLLQVKEILMIIYAVRLRMWHLLNLKFVLGRSSLQNLIQFKSYLIF